MFIIYLNKWCLTKSLLFKITSSFSITSPISSLASKSVIVLEVDALLNWLDVLSNSFVYISNSIYFDILG